MREQKKYCLDTGFFIEAWNKYYCNEWCSDYWNVLNELGQKKIIFIPSKVKDEILRKDDTLKNWIKTCNIEIMPINEAITKCLKDIYAKDDSHKKLVDSKKMRSEADPWVIAHALYEKATVVTKENKVTDSASNQIKIPNVCENMGVKCINDFDFIREMNIQFSCRLPKL